MDFELITQYLNDKQWNEIQNFNLPAYFASSISRNEKEVKLLLKIIQIFISNPPRDIEIICLKTLINSCRCTYYENNPKTDSESTLNASPKFQSHFPYEDAIEYSVRKISDFTKNEKSDDNELTLLKLYLKFVCNFVIMLCQTTQNPHYETVPDCMKSEDFKNNIINLMENASEEIATISCIFCYNCLAELIDKTYFNLDECIKLYKNFISAYTKIGCDAAKEGICEIIKLPNMFENVYDCSTLDEKKVLYVILKECFDEQLKATFLHVISHLMHKFNKISDKVTLTNNIKNLETEEPEELSSILDVLLHVCANDTELLREMQKNKSFLINCVSLLKMLHLSGKQPDSCFAQKDYTKEILLASKSESNASQVFEDYGELNSLVYGFKSKLIRMTGNLANENLHNQNEVREMDGLSVIMDCCTLDANNPMIKECSIFAIRNLCHNNMENQKQIDMMVKLESDSTRILEAMGLTLQDNDGSSVRIAPIKRNK